MTHQLTQKERMLLSDQLSHEEICIQKYSGYAEKAKDPAVRNMFNQFAREEQNHYNMLNQFLGSQMSGDQGSQAQRGQGGKAGTLQGSGFTLNFGESQVQGRYVAGDQAKADQQDSSMLQDMLMTEKYVSGTYDTAIFETVNPTIRQSLQHIQEDEQKHGEAIAKYMQEHGMYQVQQ
ncbi:MAG TPA: spore coat protein [Firmicutes bacterium]|nr:spore coat protein [Candidatus Fermentithermobacillaceae bacterium]